MPATVQIALFAALVLVPVVLNFFMRHSTDCKDNDCFSIAILFAVIWTISTVIWLVLGEPEAELFNPVEDAFAFWLVTTSFITRPTGWKLILSLLFFIQTLLGASFCLAWDLHSMTLKEHPNFFSEYKWVNGWIWLGELLIISWPGVHHALVRLVGARLRDRRRLGGPVGR